MCTYICVCLRIYIYIYIYIPARGLYQKNASFEALGPRKMHNLPKDSPHQDFLPKLHSAICDGLHLQNKKIKH